MTENQTEQEVTRGLLAEEVIRLRARNGELLNMLSAKTMLHGETLNELRESHAEIAHFRQQLAEQKLENGHLLEQVKAHQPASPSPENTSMPIYTPPLGDVTDLLIEEFKERGDLYIGESLEIVSKKFAEKIDALYRLHAKIGKTIWKDGSLFVSTAGEFFEGENNDLVFCITEAAYDRVSSACRAKPPKKIFIRKIDADVKCFEDAEAASGIAEEVPMDDFSTVRNNLADIYSRLAKLEFLANTTSIHIGGHGDFGAGASFTPKTTGSGAKAIPPRR